MVRMNSGIRDMQVNKSDMFSVNGVIVLSDNIRCHQDQEYLQPIENDEGMRRYCSRCDIAYNLKF